ncbi:Asp-tRNA(Asn)/Glu-tRNA(Gln) amidotransferase subunit GatC [Candidatus Uhrbacteria bacterium]|nr:Asp-tRNA(Asn)/Glu-tRNA(Gln) amidotransferase subunit GatC [Candidatus Uhrbacteria bacterium]
MKLDLKEVKRLAELARLASSDAELEKMRDELGRILEYVTRLSNIDTAGIPETESDLMMLPSREDEAFPCDEATRQFILSNFPDRAGDALRVPAVFEKPKG